MREGRKEVVSSKPLVSRSASRFCAGPAQSAAVLTDILTLIGRVSNGFASADPASTLQDLALQGLDASDVALIIFSLEIMHDVEIPDEAIGDQPYDVSLSYIADCVSSLPKVGDRYRVIDKMLLAGEASCFSMLEKLQAMAASEKPGSQCALEFEED